MRVRLALVAAFSCGVLGVVGCTSEPAAAPVAANAKCPKSGKPVVASVGTTNHNGKAIGFCCSGCKASWPAMTKSAKDTFVESLG